MLQGQIGTELLRTVNGKVGLCNDTITASFSIGIRTDKGMEWKSISEELHDLLIKELKDQTGNK